MLLAECGFDQMEIGLYPSLYTPIQEMTCIRPPKPTGGWYEPVNSCGDPNWKEPHWEICEENGQRYLSQTLQDSRYDNLILVKGSHDWQDYTISAKIRLCETPLRVGIIFRYQTSLNYYAAVLVDNKIQILRRNADEIKVIAEADCSSRKNEPFLLSVKVLASEFTVLFNNERILRGKDTRFTWGKTGIYAWSRADFLEYQVECDDDEYERIERVTKGRTARIAKKSKSYPHMKRRLEIPIKGLTGGKLFRFGDLTGNGKLDIIVGQAGVKGAEISCITAINQKGEVLWQKGKPVDGIKPMTSDFPIQIVDYDGDGKNKVLTVLDGKFVLLDGGTGEIVRSGELPKRPPKDMTPVHIHGTSWFGQCTIDKDEYITPKYIRPCNLTGRKEGFDFICGFGYPFLWGFDHDFNQMWQFTGNVGHFAYTYDADGDGIDEIQAGYCHLKGDGTWQFTLHQGDHADAVFFANKNHPHGDGKTMIYASGGDDGVLMFDKEGFFHPLKRGHAQRLSIGKYREDVPGYQVAVVTYWGNPGICTMYDRWGVELWSREMTVAGSNLNPVNWTGDGTELMLYSAHRDIGGLMDAEGDIVVPFPEKDHPELWVESLDFFNEGRDAIVTMDQERIVIYSPDDNPGGDLYAPDRPPLYAWSNFMANFSMEL